MGNRMHQVRDYMLSEHCQARVAAGVAAALTGRPTLMPEGARAAV